MHHMGVVLTKLHLSKFLLTFLKQPVFGKVSQNTNTGNFVM